MATGGVAHVYRASPMADRQALCVEGPRKPASKGSGHHACHASCPELFYAALSGAASDYKPLNLVFDHQTPVARSHS